MENTVKVHACTAIPEKPARCFRTQAAGLVKSLEVM